MTSQYEMQFPFTTQEEILDWESRYIEDQSEERRILEQTVISFKQTVKSRVSCERPNGYLLETELRKMACWKHEELPSYIDNNPPGHVERITTEAFSLDDDWEKLKKLMRFYGGLQGVRQSVASVILHLYDSKKYPILDVHALRTIGIDNKKVNYDEPFWRKYVNLCRAKAERYNVSMRTLDRALWKYSESGTAASHIR